MVGTHPRYPAYLYYAGNLCLATLEQVVGYQQWERLSDSPLGDPAALPKCEVQLHGVHALAIHIHLLVAVHHNLGALSADFQNPEENRLCDLQPFHRDLHDCRFRHSQQQEGDLLACQANEWTKVICTSLSS
jgi:hypothetical protein